MKPSLTILLMIFAAGCSAAAHAPAHPPAASIPPGSSPAIINWSHFHEPELEAWRHEAAATLHRDDVLLFACHGWDDHGKWSLSPDSPMQPASVETVAWLLRDAFPGRPIVLITCNPDHAAIAVPGVYFPPMDVWTSPGPSARGNNFCVGHFDQFLSTVGGR